MVHIQKTGNNNGHFLRRLVLTVMITALLLSCSAAFLPEAMAYETKYGVVINVASTSNLNVRSGPGTNYGIVGALYGGAKVTIIDEATNDSGELWYKIDFGSTGGYVRNDFVKLYTPGGGSGDMTDEEFRAQLTDQGFPESYVDRLMELHKVYPNWVFKAMHTGYEWDYVISMEYPGAKSLVENAFPSSWKSVEDYAYNWKTGEWIVKDGGRWVCASWDIIEYYMDPRNFLGKDTVFQFLEQSFDGDVQTVEGVQTILKGSFMAGELPDDPGKTYAQVIYEAARVNGVNPYVLASMVLNEQGVNGSALSDGKYPGYEGYYNFFNINAAAAGTDSAVVRGLMHAKKEGWTTRTLSINGGAAVFASDFFKAGQTTLYLKKYNVQGSKPFLGQYMTSVYGAKLEGETLARGYSEGTRATALTFTIPVFEKMPENPCPQPSGNGSPNMKLGELSLKGFALTPDFAPDGLKYSAVVPSSTASVEIIATPENDKAIVVGAGVRELTDTINKFTVKVTSEDGRTREYLITVAREAPGLGGIEFSGKYVTSGNYVIIAPGVKAETVESELLASGSVIVTLPDASSKDTASVMCTGDKLILYSEDEETTAVYTAIVKGDVNGDGNVSGSDFIKIRNHILEASILTDNAFMAADVDMNGKITGSDFIKVRNHILNTNHLS